MRFQVILPDPLIEHLEYLAAEANRDLRQQASWLLRRAIEEELRRREIPPEAAYATSKAD